MSTLPLLPTVTHDALSVHSIISRDDDAALKEFWADHFRLPSSESSRAFLSAILASAVSAGAIRCAGAALLHGADPDFCLAENGGSSLLQVAALQGNSSMVSVSNAWSIRCSFFSQVRLLLQFGANRLAAHHACSTTATQCQDHPQLPLELLSSDSRVYPCDVRVPLTYNCDVSSTFSAITSVENTEDDAKQQVSHHVHNPLYICQIVDES
jgi:hypothetical protein